MVENVTEVDDPGGVLWCCVPNCWAIFKQRSRKNRLEIEQYRTQQRYQLVLVPIEKRKYVGHTALLK
jgi:hypothetical protein